MFTQTLPNGTVVTRNIGFYPSTMTSPLNTSSPGQLNDDSNHSYNTGLQISVSGTAFMQILNSMSQGNSAEYDLNAFNCTTSALTALSVGGINLFNITPTSTLSLFQSGVPTFYGYSPAGLGEAISSMTPSPGMTILTGNSNHQNQGGC